MSSQGQSALNEHEQPTHQQRRRHTARQSTAVDPRAVSARLRAAGQRVTPQRLQILGTLRGGEHVTADEVFNRVEHLLPAVNRSTVYRTLELFRDLGLISETDLGGDARVFELLSGRHHHLICRDCGVMLDLDDAIVEPLRQAVQAHHGFSAAVDHLAIWGRCAKCAAADDERAR